MGTASRRNNSKKAAFTLVELLVVIGIIALLISILLPSLNRARAAANDVDCKARMRQIGQAVQLYASANRGVLPPANQFNRDPGNPAQNKNKLCATILSETLGGNTWELNKIFSDKDTIDPDPTINIGDNPYSITTTNPATSHYTPNIRLMPVTAEQLVNGTYALATIGERYEIPGGSSPVFAESQKWPSSYRTFADIKNASDCAMFWDAVQILNWGGAAGRRTRPAYYACDQIDNNGWHGIYNRFVSIDNKNTGTDPATSYVPSRTIINISNTEQNLNVKDSQGGIRFRHMLNTQANILYADGHVGSHRFKKATGTTDMPITELGTSFKSPAKIPGY